MVSSSLGSVMVGVDCTRMVVHSPMVIRVRCVFFFGVIGATRSSRENFRSLQLGQQLPPKHTTLRETSKVTMTDVPNSTEGESSTTMAFPVLSITSDSTLCNCRQLELLETDIFICSYPKSGTTWLQHIVLSLLTAETNLHYDHVSELAPFFEIDPHWNGSQLIDSIQARHQSLGRRVFNTHLRKDMLPSGGGGKFIYIVRSPLDACVSFYFHFHNQVEDCFEGTFAEFFEQWTNGKIAFGRWTDHVKSFASIFQNNEQVRMDDGSEFLLLTYEEMVANLPEAVARLVRFLELDVSPETQTDLLPSFTFDSMKADLDRFQPKSVSWKNQFSFLRQGRPNDSARMVTTAQRESFQTLLRTSKLQLSLSGPGHAQLRALLEDLF